MDTLPAWINQQGVLSYDMYIGFCEDEKKPYPPNYISKASPQYHILQYIPVGCGEFKINGEVHHAKEGDLVAIFPNDIVTEQADSHDPWYFIYFLFTGKCVDSLLDTAGLNRENRFLRSCQNTQIPVIMKEIAQAAWDINNPSRIPLLASKVFEIIYEITRVNAGRGAIRPPANIREDYAQRAAAFLNWNYRDRSLSVDSLAQLLGLNRSYLYRIFKEYMGISPQAYLMKIRIEHACNLLIMPQHSITSIAYQVGYEPLSFTRAFKNVTGITPQEYRKKNMEEPPNNFTSDCTKETDL